MFFQLMNQEKIISQLMNTRPDFVLNIKRLVAGLEVTCKV